MDLTKVHTTTRKKIKKMRALYKKPRLLIGTSSGYAQLQRSIQYELEGRYMDITKVHTRRRRKEGRKEKDGPLIRLGPRRPALLIGKIWECIGTLGT